jgi:hypothetical protein
VDGSGLTWTSFVFPEDVVTGKINFHRQFGGNTALTAWQVAMPPASVLHSQGKMGSDLVTPSVEQCCETSRNSL